MIQDDPFLRVGEAATFLKVSKATLARWRMQGTGPRYAKAGPRLILYNKLVLENWLDARSMTSTVDVLIDQPIDSK